MAAQMTNRHPPPNGNKTAAKVKTARQAKARVKAGPQVSSNGAEAKRPKASSSTTTAAPAKAAASIFYPLDPSASNHYSRTKLWPREAARQWVKEGAPQLIIEDLYQRPTLRFDYEKERAAALQESVDAAAAMGTERLIDIAYNSMMKLWLGRLLRLQRSAVSREKQWDVTASPDCTFPLQFAPDLVSELVRAGNELVKISGKYVLVKRGLRALDKLAAAPEQRATEPASDPVLDPPAAPPLEPPPQPATSAEPKVGDRVQWESKGQAQFTVPERVTGKSPCGKFVFVEGSKTGLPITQVRVVP